MSRAYPFRRPPSDVVAAGPWSRTVMDGLVELPAELPDWDYDTTLSLRRAVRIDGLRARQTCGLADDAALDFTVRWSASSSALRGRAWRAAVPARDAIDIAIEFELGGAELGGVLDLHTCLTLRSAADTFSRIAPRRPGSILWSDRFPILLQGEAVLFPLAIADFHDLPYPTKASWYLEVGDDLQAAALGAVLLLVNERRDVVVQALASAAAPADAERRVLSTVRTDVLRSLVERALANDDFSDEGEYPLGSLGALFCAVLGKMFPAFGVEALRRERQLEPAFFTARIQDAADLLAAP